MKSIQKHKKTKLTLVLLSLAVAVIIGGVATAFYMNTTNTEKEQESSKKAPVTSTKKTNSTDTSKKDAEEKQQLIENQTPEGPAPAVDESSITIHPSLENAMLVVRTKITPFSGSGECSLKVSGGSVTFTEKAAVIYQPEFSSCAGFSIPKTRLPSGKITLELTVTANGVSTSKIAEYTQ